jgi:hypothetical protein
LAAQTTLAGDWLKPLHQTLFERRYWSMEYVRIHMQYRLRRYDNLSSTA